MKMLIDLSILAFTVPDFTNSSNKSMDFFLETGSEITLDRMPNDAIDCVEAEF